jgi:hypothetical protein
MDSNMTKSLAQAMRERADFLYARESNSYLEHGWGDKSSVIAALLEIADVIDSWSGEYLSKELTYEENQRRRYGASQGTYMTMEERIAAVKNKTMILNDQNKN